MNRYDGWLKPGMCSDPDCPLLSKAQALEEEVVKLKAQVEALEQELDCMTGFKHRREGA